MTAPVLLITLKVTVVAVTILLIASVVAVATGRRRLHGHINTAFLILTLSAVLGLELAVRVFWPDLSSIFFDPAGPYRRPLLIHLAFAVPAALVLPLMFITGRARKHAHRLLSGAFLLLWIGTFTTGIFGLPVWPNDTMMLTLAASPIGR